MQQRSSQDHRFFCHGRRTQEVGEVRPKKRQESRRGTAAFWQRYGFVVYRARAGALPNTRLEMAIDQLFTRQVQEPYEFASSLFATESDCHSLLQQSKVLGPSHLSVSLRNTTRQEASAIGLWNGNPSVSPIRKQLYSQKPQKGTPETEDE